jgi:outer membrane protein OmpA-like peptidoglycan-associated protein
MMGVKQEGFDIPRRAAGAPRRDPASRPSVAGCAAADRGRILDLQRTVGNSAVVARLLGAAQPRATYKQNEKKNSLKTPGGITETAEGLLFFGFPVNSQRLKPEHKEKLHHIVKAFDLANPATLTPIRKVIGFTDDVRRSGGNVPLREDRADTVQLFMLFAGGDINVLGESVGAPSTQFVATNETPAGREQNRSALIIFDATIPEPPPVRPAPAAKPHTKWTIAEIGSVQPPVKDGISVNISLFRIREDIVGGQRFVLAFGGGGPGLGVDTTDFIKNVSKLGQFILKSVTSLSIDADAITGDEQPFTTRDPVSKADFAGPGLVLHADAGPAGAELIGLPMHTTPEAIDMSGPQVSAGIGAGAEAGLFIPL